MGAIWQAGKAGSHQYSRVGTSDRGIATHDSGKHTVHFSLPLRGTRSYSGHLRSSPSLAAASPRRLVDTLYVAILALVLLVPATGTFWHRDAASVNIEEKWQNVVESFGWDTKRFQKFRGLSEAFFNEHFGFRQWIVEANARATVALFGESPNPKIVIGKNGWLFYARPGYMDDYRGIHPFNQDEVDKWVAALEARHYYLASKGIPYLFVIAANKHLVYPELVPEKYNRINTTSHTDQVIAALKARGSPVNVLDLRESQLEARKTGEQIYYTHDTHWTDTGAYYGYRALSEKISQLLPDFEPLAPDRIGWEDDWEVWADLTRQMGILTPPKYKKPLRGYVLKNPTAEFPTTKPEGAIELDGARYAEGGSPTYRLTHSPGDKPRAALLRDSFSIALLPLLAESFSDMLVLWTWFDQKWLEQVAEEFRPDIVIEETLDRFLQHSPQNTSDVMERRFRTAFEDADTTLLQIREFADFKPLRKYKLDLEEAEEGVRLTPRIHGTSRIDLPKVDIEAGESVLLKIAVSCPKSGNSKLEWRIVNRTTKVASEEELYCWLGPGESTIYLALPAFPEDVGIRFRFRPLRFEELTLREAEIRTTKEPGPRLAPTRISPYAP